MSIRNFADVKSLLLDNKTIKQTIFKNTFWLMFGEGISKGLAFFLTILIARYLGAAGYGKFSFAFVFVALFAVLADFGLSTLTIREVARDKSLARKYIDNIAVMKLILGIITFGLIMITIQFLGKTPEIKILVYLAGIWVIIQSFTQFFQSIFRAFEKMQYEALSKIIYSVLLFLIAGFVLWQNLGIKPLVQSYIYADLIAFIFILFLVRKKLTKFWAEIDFDFWKKVLKRAFYFFLISTGFMIYYRIDTVILSIMKTDKIVGLYNVAFNFIFVFAILPVLFVGSIYPHISKDRKNMKGVYIKSSLFLSLSMLLVIIPLYNFREFLMKIFYGIEYINAITVFFPLCMALLIFSVGHLNYFWLYAYEKEKKAAMIVLIGVLVNIFLNLILIPKYSMVGSAYASLMTEIIILLLLLKVNLSLNKIIKT